MHPLAPDVRAGVAPERERARIVDEVDADLLEHRLGIGLDDRERLGVQDLEVGMLRSMKCAASIRTAVRSARRAAPPPLRALVRSAIREPSIVRAGKA
jgi:hypothetical protein